MERTEWSDLRQENSNNIDALDISDSGETDFALRMRNMANVSQRLNRVATTEIIMVRLAMGDNKRDNNELTTTEIIMVRLAMGVS